MIDGLIQFHARRLLHSMFLLRMRVVANICINCCSTGKPSCIGAVACSPASTRFNFACPRYPAPQLG